MSVKNVEDFKKEEVKAAKDTYRQVLIGSEQGPHFAMRRFIIEAGGSMPMHTNLVEHEQYVLGGRASIKIGDDDYQVKKGDVVFIPANIPHSYQTIGNEAFEFLCVVPNQPDEIKLID
jgi:quercetin dioxygenase-like cupin family protein